MFGDMNKWLVAAGFTGRWRWRSALGRPWCRSNLPARHRLGQTGSSYQLWHAVALLGIAA
jgi:hypothetical protein